MRIGSLDEYQPADTDYAVLLCSSEQLQTLPVSHGTVVFCFSEEELSRVNHRPAVLLDLPADQAAPVLSRLIRDRGEAEYWAPRSAAGNLCDLVGGDDVLTTGLAISGLRVSEAWIHIRVGNSEGGTRSPDDFLLGLSAPISGCAPRVRDQSVAADAMTLRALVILRAATLAKPVKKYLPGSVVVSLYKILERIR